MATQPYMDASAHLIHLEIQPKNNMAPLHRRGCAKGPNQLPLELSKHSARNNHVRQAPPSSKPGIDGGGASCAKRPRGQAWAGIIVWHVRPLTARNADWVYTVERDPKSAGLREAAVKVRSSDDVQNSQDPSPRLLRVDHRHNCHRKLDVS